MLRQVYDLARMGPTSANSNPGRFVFLRSPAGPRAACPCPVGRQPRQDDERARHGDPRLRPRVLRAPPEALLARRRAQLVRRQARSHRDDGVSQQHAAGRVFHARGARAGLDCGAMSGFDNAKVDAEFFPEGKLTQQLPHQRRLRRQDEAAAAPSAPRVRGGVHVPLGEIDRVVVAALGVVPRLVMARQLRSVDPLVRRQRQEFDERVVVDQLREDLRRLVVPALAERSARAGRGSSASPRGSSRRPSPS